VSWNAIGSLYCKWYVRLRNLPPHFSFSPRVAAAGADGAGAQTAQASFFGLHFDLHPQENDTALGRDVTEAMIERLLDAARPDYVQYDAKGHAGWLGWPSDVGPSAPGIVRIHCVSGAT
jgi:hypothetical protein